MTRNTLLCFVCALTLTGARAQSVTDAWALTGTMTEATTALRPLSTGPLIAALHLQGTVVLGNDTLGPGGSYLVRLGNGGTVDWSRPVGDPLLLPYYLRRSALCVGADDTIRFVGTITTSGAVGDTVLTSPGIGLFLATFTPTGDLVRVRLIGQGLRPVALEETASGDLVLGCNTMQNTFTVGTTTLTTYGNQGVDMVVVRMDRTGTVQWYDQAGGPGFYSDNLSDLAVHADGAVSITGHIRSDAQIGGLAQSVPTINPNGFVARYSPNGAGQWVTMLGYEPEAVGADGSGHTYAAGFGGSYIDTNDIVSGNYAAGHYLARLDSTGDVNWVLLPDDNYFGRAHDLWVNGAGDCWVAGYHSSAVSIGGIAASAPGAEAMLVYQVNDAGAVQWVRLDGSTNGTSAMQATCVTVRNSCDLAIGGYFTTSGTWALDGFPMPTSTYQDAVVARLDGCTLTTAVPATAAAPALLLRPDPAGNGCVVQWSGTAPGTVLVHDALGRLLFTGPIAPGGMQTVPIARHGMYLVTVFSAEGRSTQRWLSAPY